MNDPLQALMRAIQASTLAHTSVDKYSAAIQALALAAADGVRPFGGGEVVALPPAEETSEGRRWSF